jgi:5-methylcytosine-specific restriction endonuclease McrA
MHGPRSTLPRASGRCFDYCTGALKLSEDATCSRIAAARACRSFPVALELMASGALTLTALRMIGPHLTAENGDTVLTRACGCSVRRIEALVAEIAPRPDVPSAVRRLPAKTAPKFPAGAAAVPGDATTPIASDAVVASQASGREPSPPGAAALAVSCERGVASSPVFRPAPIADRPIVKATAPGRYRVQFTVGEETHSRLRRLQDLLRREILSGDPAVLFDRAIALLLESVEKKKLAAVRPRRSIRSETDSSTPRTADLAAALRTPIVESRHIPSDVKRAVWRRDGGQCAFTTSAGQRCPKRSFLEFHHLIAYARRGPATVANVSLRCRRHNQYEAELVFGPRRLTTAHPPPPAS